MRQRDGNQKDTPGSRAQGLVPRRGLVEVALLPGHSNGTTLAIETVRVGIPQRHNYEPVE